MKFRFSWPYFTITMLVFAIEVFIALYLNDPFIRPYVGDFLVVILLYCFVQSFIQAPVIPVAVAVLAFSYLIETLQYFNFVKLIGLERAQIANIILGNYFTWSDILAYTFGIGFIILLEKTIRRRRNQLSN